MLLVQDEFLREQVQNLSIRRQRNGAGLFHGHANFFAANFSRAIEHEPAVGIDTANMSPGNAKNCVLNGETTIILSLLHCFLDGGISLFQVNDRSEEHTS